MQIASSFRKPESFVSQNLPLLLRALVMEFESAFEYLTLKRHEKVCVENGAVQNNKNLYSGRF